jgi:hypothetical protein
MADQTAKVVLTAENRTATAIRAVEGSLKGLQQNANAVGSAMKTMFGAIGLTAGISMVKDMAKMGEELSRLSASSGIAASTLSELQYAAEKSNVPFESLANAIGKMNKSIGEAQSGSKTANGALAALGVSMEQLKKLSPEQQFVLLVGQLGKLKSEAEMASVGADIFSKSVADIIPLAKQGAGSIKTMMEQGKALGLTLSEIQIADLANVDDQIDEMSASWRTFSGTLAQYVIPALKTLNFLMTGGFDSADALNSQILRLRETRKNMAIMLKTAADPGNLKAQLAETDKQLATLELRQQKLLGVGVGGMTPAGATGGEAPGAKIAAAAAAAAAAEKLAKQAEAAQLASNNALDSSNQMREQWLKSTETDLQKAQRAMQDFENTLIDLVAGGDLTSEEAKFRWLAYLDEVLPEVQVKMKKLGTATEETSSLMTSIAEQAGRNMQDAFAQFLFDPFKGGLSGMLKGFITTVRQMIAQAASAAILKQFFGWMSNLGGGFGTIGTALLAGMGKANGGSVMSNRAYMVGERGPEMFVPSSGGSIVPNNKMGGGVTVAPVYNVDARGATADLVKALPSILEANTRRAVELARATIYDDYSRGAFGRA